jgi:hypothetical protein
MKKEFIYLIILVIVLAIALMLWRFGASVTSASVVSP